MIGRDLIMYILQNNLENDVVIETISEGEAAVKFGVGIASIRLWYKMGLIKGWDINGHLIIWKDAVDPRERNKDEK